MKKYFADSFKFTVLLAAALLFLLAAVSLFYVASHLPAAFCLLLSCVYLYAALLHGARIEIDAQGISRRFLWFPPQRLSWTEIREVGICGVNALNRRSPEKTGTLYLYFSLKELSENERFQMILHWPPRQIWLSYSRSHLQAITPFWEKEIITYNTGDLTL